MWSVIIGGTKCGSVSDCLHFFRVEVPGSALDLAVVGSCVTCVNFSMGTMQRLSCEEVLACEEIEDRLEDGDRCGEGERGGESAIAPKCQDK